MLSGNSNSTTLEPQNQFPKSLQSSGKITFDKVLFWKHAGLPVLINPQSTPLSSATFDKYFQLGNNKILPFVSSV